MWAADVYEAAPSAVAGVIASISKGATLAAAVPFVFLLGTHKWVIVVLAGASMLIGNLLGLRETRVKRILAYSSIAHVGYILLGYLAAQNRASFGSAADGTTAILYYVAAYGLSVLGAFITLSALRPEGVVTLNDLHGTARRHPVLAACMLVFVSSLASLPIPFTAGFWGKLYLFSAAFHAHYVKLAILGLIGSAIGLFYYLRILVHMFMVSPETGERGSVPSYSGLQQGVLVLSAIAIVVIGFMPDTLLRLLTF
jgi:NADH-quinone oxidoreductase subunit N